MNGILFGILGGLTAVGLEAAMKRPHFNWWLSLWWLAPIALFINYCIYRLVQDSPSLLAAIVVFSCVTLVSRVMVSWYMGQPIGVGTWMAVGLMVTAFFTRLWKP